MKGKIMTKQVSKRLLSLWNNASPETKRDGLNWYNAANAFCEGLSNLYNVPMHQVCAVVAILSPAVSWDVNKADAERVIRAFSTGGEAKALNTKVSTYGNNRKKAVSVLLGAEFVKTRTNFKTYSFFRNILQPELASYVTIDRHAVKAYKGMKAGGSVTSTPKVYKLAEQAYKALAEHLNITPCQAQAVIWVQYKLEVGR